MNRHLHAVLRSAACTLLMVASLSSCAWAPGGGFHVVDGLTASKARDQCLHYLEQTLGALPEQVFFTQQNRWGGDNSVGLVVDSAGHDPAGSDSPLYLSMDYWVDGFADADTAHYEQLFVAAWKKLGWNATEERVDVEQVTTPDGYHVRVQAGAHKGLGVDIWSPYFRDKAADPVAPQPTTIPHP